MNSCTAVPPAAKGCNSPQIPDYETSIGSASQSLVKELGKTIVLTGSLVVGVLETISLTAYVALVALATAFNSDFKGALNDGLKRLSFSTNAIRSIFSKEGEKSPTAINLPKKSSISESLKACPIPENLLKLIIGWNIANYLITDWVLPVEKYLKDECEISKTASSCALQGWHHIYLVTGIASIAAAYFLYVSRQKSSKEEQPSFENKKNDFLWSVAKPLILAWLCNSIISSFVSFNDYLNSDECVPIKQLGYTVLSPYDILDQRVFQLWTEAKLFSTDLIGGAIKSGCDFINQYRPKLLDAANAIKSSVVVEGCSSFLKAYGVGLLAFGYLYSKRNSHLK